MAKKKRKEWSREGAFSVLADREERRLKTSTKLFSKVYGHSERMRAGQEMIGKIDGQRKRKRAPPMEIFDPLGVYT